MAALHLALAVLCLHCSALARGMAIPRIVGHDEPHWSQPHTKNLTGQLLDAQSGAEFIGVSKAERQPCEDRSTFAASVMLIGFISFQMVVYYLMNFPDEDIRFYSIHIVGLSISIFSAVLLFNGCQGIVEAYMLKPLGGSGMVAFALNICHMLFWFIVLQLVTARLSGAIDGVKPWLDAHIHDGECAAEHERDFKQRALNVKTASGFLTHIVAFAAIEAWSGLQDLPFFSQSPLTMFLVVPLAFVFTLLLFQCADYMRWSIAVLDDGQVGFAEKLWDRMTEESENEMMGFVLSLLFARVLVTWALGLDVPLTSGNDAAAYAAVTVAQWYRATWILFSVAVVTVCLGMFASALRRRSSEGIEEGEEVSAVLRAIHIVESVFYTSFAWLILYTSNAVTQIVGSKWHLDTEGINLKIVVAACVSAFVFIFIFILDKFADAQERGGDVHRTVVRIIVTMGLIIGFSWEASFEIAILSISDSVGGTAAPVISLLLAAAICAIVLPAYGMYIMPQIDERRQDLVKAAREQRRQTGKVSAPAIRNASVLGKDLWDM